MTDFSEENLAVLKTEIARGFKTFYRLRPMKPPPVNSQLIDPDYWPYAWKHEGI